MIQRFSSRRQRLNSSFLTERLKGARSYDRIAGYFCSSILEVAGEALEAIEGRIRIICNSGLHPEDVRTAKAAQAALRREWCDSRPEDKVDGGGDLARVRFQRLYDFLKRGKLEVRVLPDEHLGLIHGKAGVVTLADGTRTAFLGSVNESRSAWTLNYELLWEDNSAEAVGWVQEEFDALWGSPFAVPLADFVVEDIGRIARRRKLESVDGWIEAAEKDGSGAPDPALVFIEAPVYRKQVGLWEHQKYFVKLAWDAHRRAPGGARFVLADQVGLGKTAQLAMAAELAALSGTRPVLILAPKTLLWQWQGEMLDLLAVPSAVWNGRQWVDENGLEYPAAGPEAIAACPRRIGVVSTGLVTRGSEAADVLRGLTYECVVVDEAHRARRRNLAPGCEREHPEPNNLLRFLLEISTRTRSMLLATATPVQLHVIEAWDLLSVLAAGSEAVLGNTWSRWRRAAEALALVTGQAPVPQEEMDTWDWVRTPLPPRWEHRDFEVLRRSLGLPDEQVSAAGSDWERLGPADRARVRGLAPRLRTEHNPFLRHIVRRTRTQLEITRDPETNEPYLKAIEVRLSGEGENEALRLPGYLREAYGLAEEFSRSVAKRMQAAGFLETLLLRRAGSTMAAGRITAQRMLESWEETEEPPEQEESEEDETPPRAPAKPWARALTADERLLLRRFVDSLEANQERDPKYAVVLECLKRRAWLDRGCIIFSQYLDSVRWLAEQLVEDLHGETFALYAGSTASGIYENGVFRRANREDIKSRVRKGELRLLLGTDAASEGLNLQRLGTLINLDLPWNPTRLEQRKGRIQRIGQLNDVVDIYNLRYRDSVEDRVHQMLSARLQGIHSLFGQIPDVLEDAWIEVAVGETDRARQIIDAVPKRHPFELKYHSVQKVDWESCERVLAADAVRDELRRGWKP